MWEILSLPEKYKINKKALSVENFLSKSNLTRREMDNLAPFVQRIELKYDISFADKSEIIFMDINISCQKNKWTAKDVARAVARSIPYDCMIYVHDNSMGYVSAFIRRKNENDLRRSVIERQSVVPGFLIGKMPSDIKECLTDIGSIVSDEVSDASSTSFQCIERCINRIDECKDKLSVEGSSKKKEEREKIRYFLRCGFERICIQDKFKCDDDVMNCDDYDFDEASCVECSDCDEEDFVDNEIVEPMSEEALCKSVYTFFCDNSCCDDYYELEWLLDYAEICKHILADLYNIEPDDEFYYRLGVSFSEQDSNGRDEYEDDPAIQLMEERISEVDFDA